MRGGYGETLTRNERSRQDGPTRLSGSELGKALESSAVGFDSDTINEAQRWGEAIIRSVQVWRHVQERRKERVRT